MGLLGRESLSVFRKSRGFKILTVIFLILAIPLSVILVLTYQTLNSSASTGEVTRVEIFGPSVSNGVTTSKNINLRLIYVPNSTALKASLLENLKIIKTAYAAGCNPLGGIDPKTWTLIEKYTCDPGNPGTAGQEWACFGTDGTPKAIKFSQDVSDTNRCPIAAAAPAPVSCIYSQQDSSGVHCYSGVCSGANCGFNNNCKFDPATSKPVDCPGVSPTPAPPSGGGLALQMFPITSTNTEYGIQIDIRDGQKIPTSTQISKLHPQWVRFAFPCINSSANANSCPKDYHSTNLIGNIPPGVKALAVITGDTTWNAPIGSLDSAIWKKYIDSIYIPTLQKIVSDYGRNINAIELWNEEDLNAGQYYDPYIPAASYGYMVSKSVFAIKAINPNIQIVSGGLAAGQPFYLDQAIKASNGAFQNLDAIAVHPYVSPDQIEKITTDMTNIYNILTSNNINKPVWVTEIGIEGFSGATSPKNPGEFLQSAFSQFQNLVPKPGMVNWYAYVDSMTGGNGSNDWGLYDNLGNVKATGTSFAQYASAYTPSAKAAAVTVPVYPTSFRVANTLTDLSTAKEETFDQNNKEISWTLPSGNGPKTVYAQFKVSGSWADIASSTITLAELSIQTASPSGTLLQQNATASAVTSTPSGISTIRSQSPAPVNSSPKSQFDLNGDGKIDKSDASLFVKIWQSGSNTKVADFNNDGVVNAIDFAILLKNIAL